MIIYSNIDKKRKTDELPTPEKKRGEDGLFDDMPILGDVEQITIEEDYIEKSPKMEEPMKEVEEEGEDIFNSLKVPISSHNCSMEKITWKVLQ